MTVKELIQELRKFPLDEDVREIFNSKHEKPTEVEITHVYDRGKISHIIGIGYNRRFED